MLSVAMGFPVVLRTVTSTKLLPFFSGTSALMSLLPGVNVMGPDA
jgi:hypothetical protein